MTRRHALSLGSAALVLVACVAYIMGGILRIPLQGSPTVRVEMARAGGLYQGAAATYRGIVVGKVTSMGVTSNGVEAIVRLEPGADIPRSSAAKVRRLSAIGEQFLDFEPASTVGPYLKSGDVVAAETVDLPTTVADVATSMDRLMGQVDPAKVQLVLGELSTGLSGAETDLQRLAANGVSLVNAADENVGTISNLLNDGGTVLGLTAALKPQLIQFAQSYAMFATWLQAYQPQLYATFAKAPGQIEGLRQLVQSMTTTLPSFLLAQGNVSEILNTRSSGIRALLQYFPAGLEQLSTTMRDGRIQLDIIARRGPQCVYSTAERASQDANYRPLQEDGHCSTSLTTYSQRGAQFAPKP